MKWCNGCKKYKELSEFNNDASKGNGLSSQCRDCTKVKYLKWKKKSTKHIKNYKLNYRKNNRAKLTAYAAKSRAIKIQATPKWLTKDQFRIIEDFYIIAYTLSQETNIKYEVDHIIPLRGKNISGLHVPWNLQILSKKDNMVKGNRC